MAPLYLDDFKKFFMKFFNNEINNQFIFSVRIMLKTSIFQYSMHKIEEIGVALHMKKLFSL